MDFKLSKNSFHASLLVRVFSSVSSRVPPASRNAFSNSSMLPAPFRKTLIISVPAFEPKFSIAICRASLSLPACFIASPTSLNDCSAFFPSVANLLRAYFMPCIAVSVLTPAFARVSRKAMDFVVLIPNCANTVLPFFNEFMRV